MCVLLDGADTRGAGGGVVQGEEHIARETELFKQQLAGHQQQRDRQRAKRKQQQETNAARVKAGKRAQPAAPPSLADKALTVAVRVRGDGLGLAHLYAKYDLTQEDR